MKIKFIGRGSYYAHPFHFTESNRIHEVDNELGKCLLKNGKFTEVKENKKEDDEDIETQEEAEEKVSKEKKKLEEGKKENKKSTKK